MKENRLVLVLLDMLLIGINYLDRGEFKRFYLRF